MRHFFVAASLLLVSCADSPRPHAIVERALRQPDRAWMKLIVASAEGPVVLDERLAPWPEVAGDRDPGVRRLVRLAEGEAKAVLFEAAGDERIVDACVHPSGDFTIVGSDASRKPFIVRLSPKGAVRRRVTLEDPMLRWDEDAWNGTAPTELRLGALTEDSVRVASFDEDIVVVLMSEANATLSYRFAWDGERYMSRARTLVSPAVSITPYLPIGATYDDFDAIVNWFVVHLAIDRDGRVVIAQYLNKSRAEAHNSAFGTSLAIRETGLDPTYDSSDFLLSLVDIDGTRLFQVVGGKADLDDETYALSVGGGAIAVGGRFRRELGLDNTEWHGQLSLFSFEGAELGSYTYDGIDSVTVQLVTPSLDGAWLVGGTEAWAQNPEGFSLFDEGQPFLLRLRDGAFESLSTLLPTTSGHAELRDARVVGESLFMVGFENGPLTHTGDADRTKIRADAFGRITPFVPTP